MKRKKRIRPAPHSGALMVIDGAPVRDQARREYEKVLHDLDAARAELEHFERHDQPRYQQWLSRHFGALITELRTLGHELDAKRALLFEIESEAFFSNSSPVRAYQRVMHRRENPNPAAQDDGEAGPDGFGGGGEADPFSEFAEFFAGLGEEFEEAFGTSPGGPSSRPAPAPPKFSASRLKELYRALARRLHPDAQGSLTGQKKEWWHQGQAAYQRGDVEQLQVILTLCEIDEQGSTAKTSVSLLMRITAQFRASLRALRKRLGDCRHDPAWNFSRLPDLGPLLTRTERVLKAELFELKRTLGAMQAQLDAWAEQARSARRRRRTRRRASVGQDEMLF